MKNDKKLIIGHNDTGLHEEIIFVHRPHLISFRFTYLDKSSFILLIRYTNKIKHINKEVKRG